MFDVYMANIVERLEEFRQLSFDDQKAKMILILDELKGNNQVFSDLLDIVKNNDAIGADFLVDLYHDIMDFAEAIRKNAQDEALRRIDALQDKIKKIHEVEGADRIIENTEGVLNQI